MSEASGGEARCAAHDAQAVGVCTRCGSFVCPDCRSLAGGGGGRCPACKVVPKTSSLAVVGVVLSAIPCAFIWLVGGGLSIAAYFRIKNDPDALTGKGVAVAGMILAGIWTAVMGVGVVAAIAIPNFVKYQGKSKQAEAKTELTRLRDLQEAHRQSQGTYAGDLQSLGFEAPAGARYAYFLGEGAPAGVPHLYLPPGLVTGADQEGWVAVAVGEVDSDLVLDVWQIDEQGDLVNLQDDLAFSDPYQVEAGWALGTTPGDPE
ncbi:MAG: hypothetical protein P1V51_04020 [Deltaproteobacteria bacterium]|nr:hypothetical protein [Deltaproteobacteria bacterium]